MQNFDTVLNNERNLGEQIFANAVEVSVDLNSCAQVRRRRSGHGKRNLSQFQSQRLVIFILFFAVRLLHR